MRSERRIRAALLDFDRTLVDADFGTLVAGLNGKGEESERLNIEFQQGKWPGVSNLIKRVNMENGVTLQQLDALLNQRQYVMTGAHELFEYFRDNDIVTIVASGSTMPVLQHFQRILGFDHIIGTKLAMDGDTIVGVDPNDPPVDGFKLTKCMALLTELDIPVVRSVAIGDSPADKGMLLHAGLSIAVRPVGGVEAYADHVIGGDLRDACRIIEAFQAAD